MSRPTAFNDTYYRDDDGRWRYTINGLLVPGAIEDERGMYAPELVLGRLLDWAGVGRVLGVDEATARAYHTRPPSPGHPLPPPVGRHGRSLGFSEPVIRYWTETRPGLGWRAGRRDGPGATEHEGERE